MFNNLQIYNTQNKQIFFKKSLRKEVNKMYSLVHHWNTESMSAYRVFFLTSLINLQLIHYANAIHEMLNYVVSKRLHSK